MKRDMSAYTRCSNTSRKGEGRQNVNICGAYTPSWTAISRAASVLNGVTIYVAESNGRNFSEITSAKGRSIVEFEPPEPSLLFNGAAERFVRSFPESAAFRKS